LSRTGFPKQFLCFTGQYSLFQQAALRLASLESADIKVSPPLLVTGENHRFLVAEQLREVGIPMGKSLLEPSGRNTAPALTMASMAAKTDDKDPVLVVTASDQTVTNTPAFTLAIRQAIEEATNGTIVIFGVTPHRPETGFGYIQATKAIGTNAFIVQNFVEKPDKATAQSYLDAGDYFWNAGIFVLKASVWLNALEQFRPDILRLTSISWAGRKEDGCFIRPDEKAFKVIPSESIDYSVMEHAPSAGLPIKMLLLDAGWSDLGTWGEVWNVHTKDSSGNALKGDALSYESRNNLVYATSRLVSLVGVDDLIVVETQDAVLVARRTSSQAVKHIVKLLNDKSREESNLHRKVHRPWGWFDSIDEGGHFKVKRIQVNPGASLSLQKHHYRAEHWVVVTGTAEIINGDKKLLLNENESTYIPLGKVHRLSNPGSIPLEIIEVQSGSYLGEDDIVRFEDQFGRST
jgi:mannose-1-phosphate guanylyltransferase/mannose-6-phosphate isomerase